MNETERLEPDSADGAGQPDTPRTRTEERDPSRKGAKRKAKAPMGSVAHLIRTNYESKAGVRTLRRADVRAILSGPRLEETDRIELMELARADMTLQQTKQILLLSVRSGAPKIANDLREFGRQVLAAHPLFQGMAMKEGLANPQSIAMDTAVSTLVSTDAKGMNAHGEKPMPSAQIERIRTNAIHCLVLLLRTSQRISLPRIQRCLQRHLWAPKARRHQTENQKLEALITTRDPTAAAVTFALLDDEAVMQGQKAEAATRGEQRAQTRAQRLQQQVAELERRLRQTEVEREESRVQLGEAQQAHAANDARWRNDYETLKGRTLNRLIEESSLLEEGLHALKREPPKVQVMIDHAERAIDGLKREAEQIRRNTSS